MAKADVVERMWDLAEDDMDAVAGLLAEDVQWHVPDGDHRGREAVLAYMKSSFAAADTYELDRHDTLESDDHVVVLGTVRASRGDISFESPYVWVFHVAEGRITEGWTLPFDAAGRAEMFPD